MKVSRHEALVDARGDGVGAAMPHVHHRVHGGGEHQRNVAALEYLQGVGDEERGIDDEEYPSNGDTGGEAPLPDLAHGDQQQGRGHQHRRRYRDAVGGGKVVGLAESDGEPDGDDHQHPVDRADIDLPVALCRCLGDLEPREPAELDRLAGHGKRAGDDGLAGDDRRHGGESDRGHQKRRRAQPVEDVFGGHALVEHDGGLAGVIEHQARLKQNLLDVMKNNRSRLLYERLGFHIIGQSEYKLNMQWQQTSP